MNNAQKITIAITLLSMTFILIYPPVVKIQAPSYLLPAGRNFLFSFPESEDWEGLGDLQINIKKLTAELLAIACMGGTLVILFGLKTRR